MNNIDILKQSIKNPEPFLDSYYSKGEQSLIISKNVNKPNELQRANNIIRRNISGISALKGKAEKSAVNKLVREIVAQLDVEGINYSEFTSYWEVNDVSYSIYEPLSNDI